MAILSQLDINVYLQLANCCYSNMSKQFADDLRWGRKCTKERRINLILLASALEILNMYQVGKDDNCYTEEEIQELIQKIKHLTGINFKPIGYTYIIPDGYSLDEETGTLIPE